MARTVYARIHIFSFCRLWESPHGGQSISKFAQIGAIVPIRTPAHLQKSLNDFRREDGILNLQSHLNLTFVWLLTCMTVSVILSL